MYYDTPSFIYHPKHKWKTQRQDNYNKYPYAILNICLISDILQKYHHFLAEMLGDSILFRTFAPLLKTI